MEKYTKWDDPSNGLNPFTPLEEKKQFTGWKAYARKAASVFFILLRLPCIIISVIMLFSAQVYKYIMILPPLIRWLETFLDGIICKVLLNVFSANSFKLSYHKDDKGFDFVKS